MHLFLPGNAALKNVLGSFLSWTNLLWKSRTKNPNQVKKQSTKKNFREEKKVEIIKLNYSYFLASSLQCIYVRPSRGCLAFGGSARFILQPGNPAWFEVARTVGSSPPWTTTLIHPFTSSPSKLLRIMFMLYILWIDIENLQPSFDWAKIIGKNNIQNLNLQHPKKQKLWSSRTEEALQQRERERENMFTLSYIVHAIIRRDQERHESIKMFYNHRSNVIASSMFQRIIREKKNIPKRR